MMSAVIKHIRFITIVASMNLIIGCSKEHNTKSDQQTGNQNIFQKAYGRTDHDFVKAIKQTSDKGYIIAGGTSTGATQLDTYVITTKANGDTLWTKIIEIPGADYSQADAVIALSDGSFLVCGTIRFSGNGYISSSIFLLKVNSNGYPVWIKKYSAALTGPSVQNSTMDVKQTADGGFIVLGESLDWTTGYVSLFKTDDKGNLNWSKIFSAGSSRVFIPWSIQLINDGFIITGDTDNPNAGNNWDSFIFKTDLDGNLIWAKTYGDSKFESISSGGQTFDGGYFMAGIRGDPSWFIYSFLTKTDNNGNLLWSKNYFAMGFLGYAFQTPDGGFILEGSTVGDKNLYLIKTDNDGNVLWTKKYGGRSGDYGFSIQLIENGGFIVAGCTDNFGSGNTDIYILKTDDKGFSGGCDEADKTTTVSMESINVSNFTPTTFSGANESDVLNYSVTSGGKVTSICPG
jgi:hypothetical protein